MAHFATVTQSIPSQQHSTNYFGKDAIWEVGGTGFTNLAYPGSSGDISTPSTWETFGVDRDEYQDKLGKQWDLTRLGPVSKGQQMKWKAQAYWGRLTLLCSKNAGILADRVSESCGAFPSYINRSDESSQKFLSKYLSVVFIPSG